MRFYGFFYAESIRDEIHYSYASNTHKDDIFTNDYTKEKIGLLYTKTLTGIDIANIQNTGKNTFLIPSKALKKNQEGQYIIYVFKGNAIEPRNGRFIAVDLINESDKYTEISSQEIDINDRVAIHKPKGNLNK